MSNNKGTYSRGYLPHRDYSGSYQAVTFRLADSVPKKVVETWKEELASALGSADHVLASEAQGDLHNRIARYEDKGYGECHLRISECARIAQDHLIANHPTSYELIAWSIMPNHVHVLIRLNETPLAMILKTWKGSSAKAINDHLEKSGRFWARDYFDRAIRDEGHFYRSLRYIAMNPVKAGLCKAPEDWEFSNVGSAWNPDGPANP